MKVTMVVALFKLSLSSSSMYSRLSIISWRSSVKVHISTTDQNSLPQHFTNALCGVHWCDDIIIIIIIIIIITKRKKVLKQNVNRLKKADGDKFIVRRSTYMTLMMKNCGGGGRWSDESEDKAETHESRHCGAMMVKHVTCHKHSYREWDTITRTQECSSTAMRIVNMPGEEKSSMWTMTNRQAGKQKQFHNFPFGGV
jgi:hypothetical protein